jgi:hypothetical protein
MNLESMSKLTSPKSATTPNTALTRIKAEPKRPITPSKLPIPPVS